MNEQIVRKTYLLINNIVEDDTNPVSTEVITLQDGTKAQLINQSNFTIKEIPIDDIAVSEWFVFVEQDEITGRSLVSINDQGYFIWLCLKNNKNGSIQAKTISLTANESEQLVDKINKMLNENDKVEETSELIEVDESNPTDLYIDLEDDSTDTDTDTDTDMDINTAISYEELSKAMEQVASQMQNTNVELEQTLDEITTNDSIEASESINIAPEITEDKEDIPETMENFEEEETDE